MRSFLFLFFLLSLYAMALADPAPTAQAYYSAGNKLYLAGKYLEAGKYYEAAIRIDPKNWQYYQVIGNCEYREQRYDDALHDFNVSLTLNPNNPTLQAFVNKIMNSPAVPPPPSHQTVIYSYHHLRHMALPITDTITWNIRTSLDLDSYNDFHDFYGAGLNTAGKSPNGGEFGIGGDYTFSPYFQVGLNLEAMEKLVLPVSLEDTTDDIFATQTWSEFNWGPAADGRFMFPIDHSSTFMIHAEAGYYFLSGLLTGDISVNGVGETYSYYLNSSAIGGYLCLEYEFLLDPGLGVDMGIGYRYLDFTTINYSSGSAKGVLKNVNNGNASIDFSGIMFNSAFRVF